MQKEKKNYDSNIYNKKLKIEEIYWENILMKFWKSNSSIILQFLTCINKW